MPIPAAAGYPQYSDTLITPMFEMDLLERFYRTTVHSDISTTEYSGEIKNHGDQVTFFREPKVNVRDYVKNGGITHDTVDSEPVTMTIDRAKTFSVKMNKIDEKQIQNFDKWKAALIKSAGYEMAQVIDPELMTEMWTSVDANNEGPTAGILSGNINLGTPNTPLVVTATNVNEFLTQVHQVLDEQSVWRDDRFMVMPPAGITALLNSELRLAYASALNAPPLVNGKLPSQIGDFNILRTLNVPTEIDAGTSKRVWHIVAGSKRATAFAAQIDQSRVISDKDDWDNYYQGLSVYGFKVLYPEALVHAYVTFDAS
ncbi:hypothetical protein KC887_06180 [Candidatus Kaiserbacteria bacterium]|nr:hypothetical protein [Candidatus Kaiserbacteria bacterium]